jgi:class 3 adenylate cyclase/tetratricopeptide (TPR) repeat protein
MKHAKASLLLLFSFFSLLGRAQQTDEPTSKDNLGATRTDSSRVDSLLTLSSHYLSSAPEQAKTYGLQAITLAQDLHYNKGLALAYKNVGAAFYTLGKYKETIDYFTEALATYQTMGDLDGRAMMLNNLGTVYYDQGDDVRSLDNYFKSYELAMQADDKLRIATALTNIGNVYHNKAATRGKALEYFLKALYLAQELGDKNVIGGASVNAGEVYQEMNKDDSALYYFMISLNAYKNTVDIPYALNDIGNVYEKKGDFRSAINYHEQAYNIALKFDSKLDMAQSKLGEARTYYKGKAYPDAVKAYSEALAIANSISSKKEMDSAYAGLAFSYYQLKDFDHAYQNQKLYSNLADTLNNQALADKLTNLQTNFEIVQRQNQINLLTKDKELQELDIRRQKLVKNALAVGFLMIIVIAFILYRGYRNKVKTNKILDKQKAEIEGLLLNILPAEVAQELQSTGQFTPRFFKTVSVLFTDFKSFTSHAEALTPQEVVSELNACFIAFDDIVEKYHLEKIKTIGDSYMCAGGIPSPDEAHAENIIRAGLDIQKFMKQRNESRLEMNLKPWDLRIGIHVGPVVAGVVGRKKYAYDIWGSTVNIASRMESNGEPGQVNISAETYGLIQEKFDCTYRGKIWAKNVGEIDMYFVNAEIKDGMMVVDQNFIKRNPSSASSNLPQERAEL